MSTVVDYIGRTVDVLAFQGAEPGAEVLTTQSLFSGNAGGAVVTGIQKLSQRFLMELLTESGTIAYLPDRGSLFMARLRQGRLRNRIDARTAFTAAVVQVRRNLRNEETDDTPDDEAFGGVELNGLSVTGDKLTLRITLRSLAGTSRQVILPLTVAI